MCSVGLVITASVKSSFTVPPTARISIRCGTTHRPRRVARSAGQRGRTRFCVGDFTAIGLPDHSADAVMCIDAIQFSDPPLTARV
jgi:hypothetical protein